MLNIDFYIQQASRVLKFFQVSELDQSRGLNQDNRGVTEFHTLDDIMKS